MKLHTPCDTTALAVPSLIFTLWATGVQILLLKVNDIFFGSKLYKYIDVVFAATCTPSYIIKSLINRRLILIFIMCPYTIILKSL